MRPKLHLLPVAAVSLLLLAPCAGAQAPERTPLPWAYSTWFGSGWYRVGDERDVFVVRYAPRRRLREPALGEDGARTVGIEVRLPVTVGLNHFPLDDLAGSVDFENLANVSLTPSLYFNVPVDERWSLRPFAAFGWGTVLNGGDSAWTYWAGIRSRYVLKTGALEVALYNALGFVGHTPERGPSQRFWPITNGLEFRYPPRFLRWRGEQLELHWHVAYTYFQNELDLLGRDRETEPVSDEWELALAVSRKEDPIKLWRLSFERMGLAYRFSSDGELQGLGLMFQSLFNE